MDFLQGLNPQQREAVAHTEGPAADSGGRGQRQNARHHAPHRAHHHCAARAAVGHPGGHLHQQSRRRNARARGRAAGGCPARFRAATSPPFTPSACACCGAMATRWRASAPASRAASPSTTTKTSSPSSRPHTARWAWTRRNSCSTARRSRASATPRTRKQTPAGSLQATRPIQEIETRGGGLRGVRKGAAQGQRARFRRPAARNRAPAAPRRRHARGLEPPAELRHGRRIPGHQPHASTS